MNFRRKLAKFFRNAADYCHPRTVEQHPSHAHEELYRQSLGNFTGKDWTPAEAYQRNIDYMRKEMADFEQIMQSLKGREKQHSP